MKILKGLFKNKLFSLALIIFISITSVSGANAADTRPEPPRKRPPLTEEQMADLKHRKEWGFPHRDGVVLALCGGGMKGLAHIGVFEVLEREHIPVAGIVGTSMGSIMGGLYAAGYTPAEMREILSNVNLMEVMSGRGNKSDLYSAYNRPADPGESFISMTVNKDGGQQGKLGLLGTKDLYAFLSELTARVSETDFNRLPIPFASVATDLVNGETVVLREGNLASALRASMSIPIVFSPWPWEGRLLVDGGLKANLPVIEAKKIFPGHPVIAVNLFPANISKDSESFHSVVDVASQTLDILMVDQVRDNLAAADYVITPDVLGIGTFDDIDYNDIINRGVTAAEKELEGLRVLVAEKCGKWSHNNDDSEFRPGPPTVTAVRFEGVPNTIADKLRERYAEWIGKPLDMQLVSAAVNEISMRSDVKAVNGRAEGTGRGSVAVVFHIDSPAKYEFGIDGYASNMYWNRWLSVSATARDIFAAGDSATLEYRFGTVWGTMLRYFTAEDDTNSQFGVILAARREEYEPANFGAAEFERYTAKAAWYRRFNENARFGFGYAAQKVTSLGNSEIDDSGPYMSFNYSTLDDPVLPTKGFAIMSDMWFPIGHDIVSSTQFRSYFPFLSMKHVVFSGGFKTGTADDLAYAAMLGTREELYSLGQHPLVGDQAYWLHLGVESSFIRSWWGGVNLELFGNYGQVMRDWSNAGSRWEIGAAFSVPTNNFNGKLIFVFDEEDEFTIGYTIGLPRFWDGPLP